jgi:valyl-tRNA synthetase
MQAHRKVDGKADQVGMEANQDFLARLEATIETNKEKDREELKEMWEEIKSVQAEMRFTICAFRSEMEETIQREMRAVIQPARSELDETTACNKATETEPDPRMVQSIEAAVVPVVRWPAVQKRYGIKGASSGMFRSKEIVDRARD